MKIATSAFLSLSLSLSRHRPFFLYIDSVREPLHSLHHFIKQITQKMADRITQAQTRVNMLSEQLCSGVGSLLMQVADFACVDKDVLILDNPQPKDQTEANITHFAQAISDSLLSINAIVRTLPACPPELSQQSLQQAEEANQRKLDELAAAVVKVGASAAR